MSAPKASQVARRIGLRHPIIQGPFGGGLSSVQLAAAVSNAGGLGSFGAHHLAPDEISAVARELHDATAAPFNINLWVSNYDPEGETMTESQHRAGLAQFSGIYERLSIEPPPLAPSDDYTFEQQAEAVIAARPAVFSFVFGIPSDSILKECRRCGIVTIGAATTVAEAAALEDAGVDVVIATGSDAGGHRPSFLARAEDSLVGTMALVPQVVSAVKVPVIAAGGIADARGVLAAMKLGADAVQIGTAFLACEESNCSAVHRQTLFTPAAASTKLSRYVSGRLARFIANPILRELESSGQAPLPFPHQSWFSGPVKKRAAELGDADHSPMYAGQGAPLLRHKTAAELMKHLVAEMADG